METLLRARMLADVTLAALVAARVYRNVAPQDATLPYVVFRRVSSERAHSMGSDGGNVEALVQVDCWGATAASAKAVSDAARASVSRWRSEPDVEDVFVADERELVFDYAIAKHGHSFDLRVFYRE